jgi:hypothetical protein
MSDIAIMPMSSNCSTRSNCRGQGHWTRLLLAIAALEAVELVVPDVSRVVEFGKMLQARLAAAMLIDACLFT